MQFIILASEKDIAGMNIAKELDKLGIKGYFLQDETIYSENIDKKIPGDFYIFVSKHQSEKQVKSLTVHAPGNWNQADFGGQVKKVCPISALFLKYIFQILEKNAKHSGYEVSLEVTHHGPYIEKPCCFIEIGSTEKQWKDEKAIKIIAKTVKESILKFKPKKEWISAIGIGGPHYCPNFNKIQLNTNYSLGHIIPEYHLPLTQDMLQEALEKTIEKPKVAILDWKGCGKSEQRKEIIMLLEKKGITHRRSDQVD